jgi:hypothetical protein
MRRNLKLALLSRHGVAMNRLLPALLLFVGCAHGPQSLTPTAISTLVSASDRTDADKALDPGRKPAEFLAFIGAGPGMKVADLMAGGGYTGSDRREARRFDRGSHDQLLT